MYSLNGSTTNLMENTKLAKKKVNQCSHINFSLLLNLEDEWFLASRKADYNIIRG